MQNAAPPREWNFTLARAPSRTGAAGNLTDTHTYTHTREHAWQRVLQISQKNNHTYRGPRGVFPETITLTKVTTSSEKRNTYFFSLSLPLNHQEAIINLMATQSSGTHGESLSHKSLRFTAANVNTRSATDAGTSVGTVALMSCPVDLETVALPHFCLNFKC